MVRGGVLQGEAGLEQIRQGLTIYRAMGAEVGRSFFLALLAEVYGKEGQIAEGLAALAEAEEFVAQTGERYWEAEIYRQRGELLLAQSVDHQSQAERCFQQALDVARSQEAKSLELRAAMSLARLWQRQGKRTEACELLAPIYGWFTEGFDTVDLREAKALLDELT